MQKRLVIEIVAAALVAAALVCITLWVYRDDKGEGPSPCDFPLELRFPDDSSGLLCNRDPGELASLLDRKGLDVCLEAASAARKDGEYPMYLRLEDDCRVSEKKEGTLTGRGSLLAGVKLDVNQATAADLEAVPGIGKAIGEAIVSERMANGPFCPLTALTRVKGIGEKKLQKFSAYLTARCR